jgi:hypothetical protein
MITVKDDAPEGFSDLAHAYTLFAKNRKRRDATRRGRFNLGEKQVLACCEEATIVTTTGTVAFDADGTRQQTSGRRNRGSMFRARIRMTREQLEECERAVLSFIPPKGILTTINGKCVEVRDTVDVAAAKLTTEWEHDDGSWRRTKRETRIGVYEPRDGEKPHLYEMGIPVVELDAGDCYHYDVDQRVPLNQDRDNVSPAYLRDLRAEVMNVVAEQLTQEEASADWAREATGSNRIKKEAFEAVIHKRYGPRVASFSVNDMESNHAAAARGFTVLSGGSLTSGEWANAKCFESVRSAHAVAPTARPEFKEGGVNIEVPQAEWSKSMHKVVAFVEDLGRELLGGVIVRIVRSQQNFEGWYGQRELSINLRKVGHRFFDGFPGNMATVLQLALHEFAHEFESNHLSDGFHRAVTSLAAAAVALALTKPKLFKRR